MRKVLLFSLGFLFLDQIVKNIMVFSFSYGQSLSVIGDFFRITLVENTGAAFSILSSNTIFLIMISFVALLLLYFFFIKDKELSKGENVLYGALVGGIAGNLLDRIFRGYVVDYFDFNFLGINFPVFNLADIFITISIIILVIIILKGDKDEVSGNRK